jgi:hypothetical protein
MPFIRGRYYINPIAGAAIEKAREADEADGSRDGDGTDDSSDELSASAPVRRIEIEATEIVPAASGRAQRGFVARVHRGVSGTGTAAGGAGAETHVFADHRDLLGFLGGELGEG